MCLVDSFLNYKKVSGKGIRPNTISKYSNELNRLLTYFRDKKQHLLYYMRYIFILQNKQYSYLNH